MYTWSAGDAVAGALYTTGTTRSLSSKWSGIVKRDRVSFLNGTASCCWKTGAPLAKSSAGSRLLFLTRFAVKYTLSAASRSRRCSGHLKRGGVLRAVALLASEAARCLRDQLGHLDTVLNDGRVGLTAFVGASGCMSWHSQQWWLGDVTLWQTWQWQMESINKREILQLHSALTRTMAITRLTRSARPRVGWRRQL